MSTASPTQKPSCVRSTATTSPVRTAGKPLSSFTQMRADGSTSGGCWIYTGIFADGVNQSARRKPGQEQDETASEWAWAWPANRRVLYNRASADPQGRPWSERKKYIWWDEDQEKWTGKDVPDFPIGLKPGTEADPDSGGPDALAGDDPFIMQSDGKGWLYAPKGMVDGPLPTHYEPPESPITNPSMGSRATLRGSSSSAGTTCWLPPRSSRGQTCTPTSSPPTGSPSTTQPSGMSRFLPYLAELQPEMFCEVSEEFAELVGLENYGWATIISPRSAIEARVLVTNRVRALTAGGRRIHQVGLPYHWGSGTDAVVEGDSANDLLGIVLDPNVQIQGSKAAQCAVLPGRRPAAPSCSPWWRSTGSK